MQNQETKRSTFVEVDVENLHWSWGSGAQQILATRVDASELPEEQKRTLKESLQKTACGLSNVVLTPGPRPAARQALTRRQKERILQPIKKRRSPPFEGVIKTAPYERGIDAAHPSPVPSALPGTWFYVKIYRLGRG